MPAIVIPAPISSNHAAPVTAGGTGATTAAAARTNLDVYSKSEVTNAISQSTANLTIVKVDKIVTLPAGTDSISTTVIDLSEYIPTGKHLHAITDVSIGTYSLPYVGNDGTVMAFLWQTKATTIEIKNKASAWENYRLYAVLFLADG